MRLYTIWQLCTFNQTSLRSKAGPAKLWELSSQVTEISPLTARLNYNDLFCYKRQFHLLNVYFSKISKTNGRWIFPNATLIKSCDQMQQYNRTFPPNKSQVRDIILIQMVIYQIPWNEELLFNLTSQGVHWLVKIQFFVYCHDFSLIWQMAASI